MTYIYFVRHGYSCSNLLEHSEKIKFLSETILSDKKYKDPHLTNWGIFSSILAGKFLKSNKFDGVKFDKIYCSPLIRTWETASCMFSDKYTEAEVAPYLREKSKIENNREAGQLTKSEDEIENLSILFQEFIDEMEKGGVSNGKIMIMKKEIEKNKRYNIIQNCHILEEKLKELKKDGDTDNKKNSIIIKIDQLRDLNEKVEQISEFIIKNDQKAKQSRESEAEQQPVTETGQTAEEGGVGSAETPAEAEQTAAEQEGTEPLETVGTAEEQGIETTEVSESYEKLIEELKEINRLANVNFANLSSKYQALMTKLGLGGDLSSKEIKKVKEVIGAGIEESASASNVNRALVASSLYAPTHREAMQILDKSFWRIEELGSMLDSEILKLKLQEKQRAQLEPQRATAVDNLTEAVGNARRQQSGVQEGENHGPVSAGESLGSEIDPNINRDIDRMGSRNSIGKTHKNIVEYLGYSKEIKDGNEIEFKKDILDNMKAKEYGTVRSKCDEQIREIRKSTVLDEKYQRVLIAFYKKIIKIVDENEAKKNQKLLDRLLRRKVKTVSRESKVVEDLEPDRMRTVDGTIVSLEPEPTNDISDEAEEETPQSPQSPQASEIPVINNPDTREISSQIKEKIKGKLKEVKNKNKNQFDAISGFKNSTNLEKTVNENCNQNPIFKSLIVGDLFNSMSQDEKDEIYKMKTRDLLDLYDEVNRE